LLFRALRSLSNLAVTMLFRGITTPLLLMLPWLGSRPQAVAKYCEIYFRTGFDVLIVESEVSQFLWPGWGLDYGARVLDVQQSDRFVSRPLLVHAFSIGGYTFTQLLVHISHDTQKYHSFIKRIKGHIYDSLVLGSLERMATGLSKNLFPRLETFKCHTVDYFNTGINVWHLQEQPCRPHLLLPERHAVLSQCRKWEESTHAGHLGRHPQEYLFTLETFLQSLSMVPLKAKM
uniref:Uncharacterized protein n=1 Tax=Oncorhynchus mykiss TaxID=8022 RepID=A0A8C7PD15_ONCMY